MRLRTLVLHKTPQLLPSPQVPHLDDLIRAPSRKPLPSLRGNRDGFDARDVSGEDENGLEVEAVVG